MMNIILLILSIAVFSAFTLFVKNKYGVQHSISASIKVLTGILEKSYYSWFILGVAIPMMIVSNTALGWWAGALLSIDAAAVSAGDRLQIFLHCFGADAGIAVGMLMLILNFHLWWLVAIFALFCLYALIKKIPNIAWWIETAAFMIVTVGLLISRVF